MSQVEKLLKKLEVDVVREDTSQPKVVCDHSFGVDDPSLCKCCCASHCALSLHVSRGAPLAKQSDFALPVVDAMLEIGQVQSEYMVDTVDDYLLDESSVFGLGEEFAGDSFMTLVTALNMDLQLA